MNSRLSKLKYETVKHKLISNPYEKSTAVSDEADLLAAAVIHALSQIDKLSGRCGYLGKEIQGCVDKLKSATESLQSLTLSVRHPQPSIRDSDETSIPAAQNRSRPWTQQIPATGKKTRLRR